MSELISGKEALIALANGETIQAQYKDHIKENCWFDILSTDQLSVFDRDDLNFRLKKKTIILNDIEVPAPMFDIDAYVEKRRGENYYVYYLDSSNSVTGYSGIPLTDLRKDALNGKDWSNVLLWSSTFDIEQVVAALRNVFKGV